MSSVGNPLQTPEKTFDPATELKKVEETTITEELDNLGKSLECLKAAYYALADKLTPVVKGRETEPNDCVRASSGVALLDMLYDRIDSVRFLETEIREITSCLRI